MHEWMIYVLFSLSLFQLLTLVLLTTYLYVLVYQGYYIEHETLIYVGLNVSYIIAMKLIPESLDNNYSRGSL